MKSVVSPTVAVMQWRNEIAAHTEGMKVLVWHGASRISDVNELKQYDVVRLSPHGNRPSPLTIGIMAGFDYIRHPRKLLPKTAEWIQTQRDDHQRTISNASNSMESHCGK